MISIVNDFNLKPYNTFGMDVKCDEWIEFTSADDIPQLLASIGDRPYLLIGSGSNMLFVEDYAGVVIHPRILDAGMSISPDGSVLLRAGAGIELDNLIESCARDGLWGLENLSGIPGEVGASAVQNVGAYGVEAKDVIVSVECYDTVEHRFLSFDGNDCGYEYRNSMFKHIENKGRYIITYVTYAIRPDGSPRLQYGNLHKLFEGKECISPSDVREAVIYLRNEKLPKVSEIGSAGSFFKNPIIGIDQFHAICDIANENSFGDVPHYILDEKIKVPAAWLIERCGLKGYSLGNAAVWHKQPLVIINATGKANPEEIIALEQLVIKNVESKFGITLEPEVEHIKSI